MNDKDKMGILAIFIWVIAIVIGVWALMKTLALLFPVIIVVSIVGLILKYRK